MKNKLSAWIIAVLVFGLLFVSRAQAAESKSGSNITVRPFLQDIRINPADTSESFVLTLTNDSKFKQIFHLSTINFGSLGETGGIAFQGSNVKNIDQYGLSKWLRLERNNINLEAGQQTSLKVTLLNDNDLAPGAHYAAIITTASRPITQLGQLNITPKVSSLVFATKIGGEKYDIHLQSLSHNGSAFKLPTAANVRIKSAGNTYIVPRGIVTIRQDGRQISKGIINAQSALVLPQTIRNFNVPLNNLGTLNTGLFSTKYIVRVDYRYDGIERYASKDFSYRIINYKVLAAAFIAAAAIVVLAKYKHKKIIKLFKDFKKS